MRADAPSPGAFLSQQGLDLSANPRHPLENMSKRPGTAVETDVE